MIKVSQPYSFSEIGKRENNEDFAGHNHQNCFVVCDGVGGNAKGEIASEIVGNCFLTEFARQPNSEAPAILEIAESNLSAYIQEKPESSGMASTLTFSQIRQNEIYLAWCGDSRIYQFREGRILFKTEDHSWVNEALKSGIITKEEAVNHPKSNVITRAISSSEKPTMVDVFRLVDVKKGDFVLHCTDGVLEAWNESDLEALFGQGYSTQRILERLKSECDKLSRDNATALIYRLDDVNLDPGNVVDNAGTKKLDSGNPLKMTGVHFKRKWILVSAIFLALAIALLIFNNPQTVNRKEVEKPTITRDKNTKPRITEKEIKPNLPDTTKKNLSPDQLKPQPDSNNKKIVPLQNKPTTTI